MSTLRVRDIEKLSSINKGTEVAIESLPVWDYKVLNNKLRLIWEPILGAKNVETVTWGEIKDYLLGEDSIKNIEMVEIVPETGGESFKLVEENSTFINLRLK